MTLASITLIRALAKCLEAYPEQRGSLRPLLLFLLSPLVIAILGAAAIQALDGDGNVYVTGGAVGVGAGYWHLHIRKT